VLPARSTLPPSSRPSTVDLDVAFETYRESLIHAWAKTISVLGFTLNGLFVGLDLATAPPALFWRFTAYRAVVTAVMIAQWFVLRRTRPGRWSIVAGYVAAVCFAGMISRMTVDLGGFESPYYAGLNLAIVGVNLLLPWRAFHTVLNGFAVIATYVGLNLLSGSPLHAQALLSNVYFMGATVVISAAISHVRSTLIASEFALRAELVQANSDLDGSRRELKTARDALWGEMEVAKRIQTSLLPANRRVGGYDVAARMSTAAEVGGDYYDIIHAGEDRDWVAIGDVSGHGVESGLVMMMTQTSISSLVREDPRLGPADVFHAVNEVLTENISRLGAARYMTLNVVRLGERGLVLAGKHQDVLVWRCAARRVETVSNEGCWLGVVGDTRGHVVDQALPMDEGDLALFFTDGATEAMSAGGEMFGEERLAAALAEVAERPLDAALEHLFERIAAWRPVQEDDVTLMLVRRARDAAGARQGPPAPAAERVG
jgi:serine phosphatase RsbU (regulator of sigma subunit)